jgi:hypothetical protein
VIGARSSSGTEENTMDLRNDKETRNRWTTALRMATVVVVLGTLAAVWHPTTFDAPAATHEANIATIGTAYTATPDMSVYFPDRFPAPTGNADEPQPPTF